MSDYKMMPVEPTPEMVSAAEDAYMPFGDMELALRMAVQVQPVGEWLSSSPPRPARADQESEMNVTYQNGWAVPAGWKLVPEKPTYELESEVGGVRMDEESFLHEYADHEKIGEICRAVVKYSPPPPKAPDYNPSPLEVSVIGMPEFDALLDHIYEEGTSSEGAVHLANKLVRVAIQSHITHARNAQPAPDVACSQSRESSMVVLERDALEAATEALAAHRKGGES